MSTLVAQTNRVINRSDVTSAWTVQQTEEAYPKGCVVLGIETGGFIPWDNPDNVVSRHVEQAVDTAVVAVCLPILFLISAPSNILNMLVFWKQGLKERINLCFFYLSLIDFLHMLHAFFCNVDRFDMWLYESVEFGPVLQFIVDHKLLGLRSLTWLSGFASMLIACERCLCVVSPLRSQTVLSTRTTGFILLFFTPFSLTGSFLNGLRWSIVCVFNPVTNTTSKAMLTGEFYARHRSYMDVVSLYYVGIQPFIYVMVTVATTIVTSVKLKSIVTWREQTSSRTMSPREIALTRMLIAASILYIICSIPTTFLGIGLLSFQDISLNGRYRNLACLFVHFFELASYINATFNFFIYISLGSKYRGTLQTLLPGSCWHQNHQKKLVKEMEGKTV